MNLVAFEPLANPVGPGQQIENVRGRFQIEQVQRLLASDGAAAQHPLAKQGDEVVVGRVN